MLDQEDYQWDTDQLGIKIGLWCNMFPEVLSLRLLVYFASRLFSKISGCRNAHVIAVAIHLLNGLPILPHEQSYCTKS